MKEKAVIWIFLGYLEIYYTIEISSKEHILNGKSFS